MRVETFEQARAVALDWARPGWDPKAGTLHALESGQEDDWFWRVVVGPREYLVDGDLLLAPMDDPVLLVAKETGKVVVTDFRSAQDGLARMRPCGEGEIHDPVGAKAAQDRAQKATEARLARRRAQRGK